LEKFGRGHVLKNKNISNALRFASTRKLPWWYIQSVSGRSPNCSWVHANWHAVLLKLLQTHTVIQVLFNL
jgi:hypothetical protein